MNEIYKVRGTLNRDFVGQISYSVSLGKRYEKIHLHFVHDKQRFDTITPETRERVFEACNGLYGVTSPDCETLTNHIRGMKTELQLIVTHDDAFVGGMHRPDNPKEILLTTDETTTEGFMPQEGYDCTLKITVVAFSVILDDTNYTLTVSGE